jgi:phosphoribosylformylglycinamidine cyclo-ligase
MRYRESGVDIDAATTAIQRAKKAIASTWGPQVASDVGSFGGLFRQPDGSYLVSSIDGVGTKLKVGLAAGRLAGLGADLVNHCVNDILVQGATPLFFLDYFAAGRLDGDRFVAVLEGMAKACRENACALIGGETAEMPGVYHGEDFDLAGCIVGRVEPQDLLTGETVEVGMEVYAWTSTGLHTNGYSLARKVLLEGPDALALDAEPAGLGGTLADALLAMHRSYLQPVLALRQRARIAALAHITGGGLVDNVPRVLPDATAVELDPLAWTIPPIFQLIAQRGQIPVDEMRRVFNLGVGMVVVAPPIPKAVLATLEEPPFTLGRVVARAGRAPVRFLGDVL